MMKSIWAALLAAVFLASCGGGEEVAQQTDLSNAPLALADSSACKTPSAEYALVNGQCVKTWVPMRAPATTSLPAQRSIPSLTNAALYSWAAQTFPQYFFGATQDGFIDPFTYRYFAGSHSYIGIWGTSVYVLGPLSDYQLLYVGEMSAFACLVNPAACDVPADTSTTSTLQVNSSLTGSIDWSGDEDWHAIFLTAGQSYVFDLEGSPTGQGTLADTYLALYSGSGSPLAQNDDVESSRNSRLTYTPSSSGWYYLSAQGYGTLTGTYRLTATLNSSGGGGGGGGGGGSVDWTSSFSAEEIVEYNSELAANGRQGWTFDVTGGQLAVETIFAAQYTASLYVTSADSLSSCVNGGAFNYYTSFSFVGQQGFRAFTLDPGSYGICVVNSTNASNAMRVEFQRQPDVTGFHYLQDRFPAVVETISGGGRFVQTATVGDTYRVIVDGANSGGTFYIIPASELQAFLNGGAFNYYTEMTNSCGASGRASPGLCELTGVGQYAIAYVNDTGSPQSIVIVGRDYVPD